MSKLYPAYLSIKKLDSSTILLFKSGIFYILLENDARIVSSILNLKLSNLNQEVVKCSFHINSLEKYLPILVKNKLDIKIIDLENISINNNYYNNKNYNYNYDNKKNNNNNRNYNRNNNINNNKNNNNNNNNNDNNMNNNNNLLSNTKSIYNTNIYSLLLDLSKLDMSNISFKDAYLKLDDFNKKANIILRDTLEHSYNFNV